MRQAHYSDRPAQLLALALCRPGLRRTWTRRKAFLDTEINGLSTLSRADQEKEMQWFVDAAKPFTGMEINVVSETITTHEYEVEGAAPRPSPRSPASRSRTT